MKQSIDKICYESIGVLLADALHLVQAEPVVRLRVLSQADDQLVRLLSHLACLGQDVALSLWHCEDPVLALVVVDADLEASIKEAGDDLFSWQVSDSIEGKIHSE